MDGYLGVDMKAFCETEGGGYIIMATLIAATMLLLVVWPVSYFGFGTTWIGATWRGLIPLAVWLVFVIVDVLHAKYNDWNRS